MPGQPQLVYWANPTLCTGPTVAWLCARLAITPRYLSWWGCRPGSPRRGWWPQPKPRPWCWQRDTHKTQPRPHWVERSLQNKEEAKENKTKKKKNHSRYPLNCHVGNVIGSNVSPAAVNKPSTRHKHSLLWPRVHFNRCLGVWPYTWQDV